MANQDKVHIVGIGDDGLEGLTPAVRAILDSAETIVGTRPTINMIPPSKNRVTIDGSLDALVDYFRGGVTKNTVLLASGDPLFYGVARYLCDRIGKDQFEVVPHVSSMQLAFARVKESWDDAYLANLATQSLDRVVDKIRLAEKVGLFTTTECSPKEIAGRLLDRQIDYFSAYVCENLGSRDERVTQGELREILDQPFGPLNVMILVRKPEIPDRPSELVGTRVFGNPDDLFQQSQPKRGLLTRMEIRVIALAEMDLGPRSVVWDVGAGTGSVSIEAARLARDGKVYAIEMDPDDQQLLISNSQAFHVRDNLIPVLGTAPAAWATLPDPDAIFVGGTGRAVARLVGDALNRLRSGGRLVVHINSLENLTVVRKAAIDFGCDVMVRMINIAHSIDQLEEIRFEAMNPTFLMTVVKP